MSNVIDMKDFFNFNTAIPQNCFESTAPWEPSEQVSELKARLLYSLKSCLSYLLPGGVFQRNKFYVGDVQGNPGQSLVVELEGNRIGMWHDLQPVKEVTLSVYGRQLPAKIHVRNFLKF